MRTLVGFVAGLLVGAGVWQHTTAQEDKTLGLMHVAFSVDNLEETTATYTKVFGLQQVHQLRDKEGRQTMAYLQAGPNTFVEFLRAGPDRPAGYQFFGLHVSDADAAAQRMKAQGLKVDGPISGSTDSRVAFVHVPGGRVELVSYGARSPRHQWFERWKQ